MRNSRFSAYTVVIMIFDVDFNFVVMCFIFLLSLLYNCEFIIALQLGSIQHFWLCFLI